MRWVRWVGWGAGRGWCGRAGEAGGGQGGGLGRSGHCCLLDQLCSKEGLVGMALLLSGFGMNISATISPTTRGEVAAEVQIPLPQQLPLPPRSCCWWV